MFAFEEYDNGFEIELPVPRASPVRVVICDGPPLAPPAAESAVPAALDRKRITIWQNEARNGLIAEIAEASAERRIEPLWENGLLLDDAEFPIAEPGPGWVAVLVESLEHARALSSLLPDWAVLAGTPDAAIGDLGMEGQYRSIITVVRAYPIVPFAPDVLIVALGGDWPFRIEGYPPQQSSFERLGRGTRCPPDDTPDMQRISNSFQPGLPRRYWWGSGTTADCRSNCPAAGQTKSHAWRRSL